MMLLKRFQQKPSCIWRDFDKFPKIDFLKIVAKIYIYCIFVTKIDKYGIFVTEIDKHCIFVTEIDKYGIFVAKSYKCVLCKSL